MQENVKKCEIRRYCSFSERENTKEYICESKTSTLQRKKETCGSQVEIWTKDSMHIGSQISCSGNGGNVAFEYNNQKESINCNSIIDTRPIFHYSCNKCKKSINKKYTHEQHLKDCFKDGIEGIDYVECKLCKFASRLISKHVNSIHKNDITKEDYELKFGKTICENTSKKLCSLQQNPEYKKKMSESVSKSIMANPQERNRRAEQWAKTNRTDASRKKSSDTAKITSARLDIQQQRTDRLINSYSPTLGEKALCKLLFEEFPNFGFAYSQRLKDESFIANKSKIRQIDIVSNSHKILVEFDGGFHFYKSGSIGTEGYSVAVQKDKELNKFAIENGYMLIRISYDELKYKNNDITESCKDRIRKELMNIRPELILIGKSYDDEYLKERT